MAEVQACALPNVSVTLDDKDAMVKQLDGLLEKYLSTLDKYQKARQELTSRLSAVSGFRHTCIDRHIQASLLLLTLMCDAGLPFFG